MLPAICDNENVALIFTVKNSSPELVRTDTRFQTKTIFIQSKQYEYDLLPKHLNDRQRIFIERFYLTSRPPYWCTRTKEF